MPQDTKTDVQLTKVFHCCLDFWFWFILKSQKKKKKTRIVINGNKFYPIIPQRHLYLLRHLWIKSQVDRQVRGIKNKLIKFKNDHRAFPFKMTDRTFISMPTQWSSEITKKKVFLKLCIYKCAISGPEILRNMWKI